MKTRDSRNKSPALLKLKKEISPHQFQNMLILGLNIPLHFVQSENDLQRVIVFLNKSLINSRDEFDQFMNEVVRLNTKNVQLKAHIMKNMKKYKEFDPEVFNFLDE